jgi:opacity protein-like surface antigen
MRAPLAALAAVALLAPTAARAQPVSTPSGPGPDTYIQLHLGAFDPRSSALDALDTGWAVGAAFGARFTPNLSAEAGVGFYRATGSGRTLSDVPLTASLRLRAPLKVAELSAIAGVGLHLAALNERLVGVATAPAPDHTSDDAAFGYHVGAALGFNLSPTMLVGAEALWTFVEPRFFGARTKIDGLRVAVTLGYHF